MNNGTSTSVTSTSVKSSSGSGCISVRPSGMSSPGCNNYPGCGNAPAGGISITYGPCKK